MQVDSRIESELGEVTGTFKFYKDDPNSRLECEVVRIDLEGINITEICPDPVIDELIDLALEEYHVAIH